MAAPKISNTLRRLAKRLYEGADQQEQFIQSVVEPVEYPVAVVWMKDRPDVPVFDTLPRPTWMPEYVDLVSFEQRPGRHALHDAGEFYCLDPSSVFMAQGLQTISSAGESVGTVLDVCASPGGKSVLAWRALRPGSLFSNEVIGKRTGALISNLKRCGIEPVYVISSDTERLARDAAATCDVVLVDAPCSGQSLVARGKDSPGCFHPATINMNANRQRRILANSTATVKPGGWLVYMTCTYSLKENERNVEWLLKRHPDFTPQTVESVELYRSGYSVIPCYRLVPNQGVGAGGFMAVLRKDQTLDSTDPPGSLEDLYIRWNSADKSVSG